MKRLGIFGGSFDPPHVGHLAVAQAALRQLQLDEVYWIPALHSPFKALDNTLGGSHRLEMVRLMTQLDPHFILDQREMSRKGPSYTVDTLESIHKEEPDAELFLILGADSALGLPSWKAPQRIRQLCKVVAYHRVSDNTLPVLDASSCDIVLTGEPMEISSSGVRDAVSKKFPIDRMVTAPVAEYIEAHGLYLAD